MPDESAQPYTAEEIAFYRKLDTDGTATVGWDRVDATLAARDAEIARLRSAIVREAKEHDAAMGVAMRSRDTARARLKRAKGLLQDADVYMGESTADPSLSREHNQKRQAAYEALSRRIDTFLRGENDDGN